ncbi:MAG: glycosyltransferase family 2 protein [Candidatus Babeliales bacterium]|nr:glycosyltransferase family 2 protein [Candidatus Babeliales bacterium]
MFINKILAMLFITISITATDIQNKHFVIIIPSYNNKYWFQRNLDSVITQNYDDYEAVYIDDASKDKTAELVEQYIKERNLQDKIKLIKNTQNKGALHNLYDAIHNCKPTDIVITLDADDWFAKNNVLSLLNNIYQDTNVWMTYGNYVDYPTYTHGSAQQVPHEIISDNNFRNYPFWVTTHLRTFYAGLFQKIKYTDLLYETRFYPMAWDCALMYPMLEMSGMHSKFISDILYVYNIATPINDMKTNKELQCRLADEIKNKEKYQPIERLFNEE